MHGYALSLDCWHFQRKHFRSKIRIVLYDQRSHGRSGRRRGSCAGCRSWPRTCCRSWTRWPATGPVVLVGHSMGGMTIMHLALTHPELFGTRIRGVALFSTAAGEMADYSPIRGLPGRTFGRIAQPTMAALNRIPEVVERGRTGGSDLGFVFTRKGSYGSDVPPSYVEFMNQMLGQTPMSVISDFYPAFAELDEYDAFSVLATVETAVIGGEDDAITPIKHTDKIIELLPAADARRLPDCGHMGIIEHHELFSGVVEALYEAVAEGAARSSTGSRRSPDDGPWRRVEHGLGRRYPGAVRAARRRDRPAPAGAVAALPERTEGGDQRVPAPPRRGGVHRGQPGRLAARGTRRGIRGRSRRPARSGRSGGSSGRSSGTPPWTRSGWSIGPWRPSTSSHRWSRVACRWAATSQWRWPGSTRGSAGSRPWSPPRTGRGPGWPCWTTPRPRSPRASRRRTAVGSTVRSDPMTHLESFRRGPAIGFELGAADRHIPPGNAHAFRDALGDLAPDAARRVRIGSTPAWTTWAPCATRTSSPRPSAWLTAP